MFGSDDFPDFISEWFLGAQKPVSFSGVYLEDHPITNVSG